MKDDEAPELGEIDVVQTPAQPDETGGTGPYTMIEDSAGWDLKRRPGVTITAAAESLAGRLLDMKLLIDEIGKVPTVLKKRHGSQIDTLTAQAKVLACDALVQEENDDTEMAAFKLRGDEFEERLCRGLVRPHHRRTVIKSQVWAFIFAILGAALAMFAAENITYLNSWALQLGFLDKLLLLFCGASLGRCVGLLLSFYAKLDTVSTYRALQDDLAHPWSAVLNDLIMVSVAYLVFSTGFVVLTFGGDGMTTDGVASGMSSANVDSSHSMALVFGLVVGMTRAAFLQGLSDTAKQTTKGTTPTS